jgi:hypothetical protein
MTTLPLTNSIHRPPSWLALVLIPLALTCLALLPMARGVDPPPDAGYPNRNTAEGINALFRVTNGSDNTANAFNAPTEITGGSNTANGVEALFRNTTGKSNTADRIFDSKRSELLNPGIKR